DGDRITLDGGELRHEHRAVSAGHVYVDGLEIDDSRGKIRDRRHLADDGVIIVTLVLDGQT
ncbi:MAG: hypothetical protein GWO04_02690, partial [Actinobacteria bacterium]|nr:hypothetical protein [Actinomycetota bacterium]NIT94246.1 hypothetical protein [Actinomycetota bacterium]NIV54348.1 hypothetical protein [Actinomycetota bacterium]NIV85658.1 hypothetical protein [Actinomycetota bacterium]NIX49231.1 hypothetical protein [Actinomycetota bacterium]